MGSVVRHRDHVGSCKHVQVLPHPEWWCEDGNLLAPVEWKVSPVVQVGAEGLHGCGEDPCPWRASVGGDPVTYLVVRCAVALGGPGVGCGTGKVPDTSFSDSVGQGEDVVVDGGGIGFGGDEDEGAV